jgi:hypothetical protein
MRRFERKYVFSVFSVFSVCVCVCVCVCVWMVDVDVCMYC